jgi:hypothetical protein
MMHRLSDSSLRRVTTATNGVPFAMWRGVDLYLRLLEQRTIAIASPGARVLKIVSWTLQLLFILGIGSCFLQVERASQCTSEFCYVLSDYCTISTGCSRGVTRDAREHHQPQFT